MIYIRLKLSIPLRHILSIPIYSYTIFDNHAYISEFGMGIRMLERKTQVMLTCYDFGLEGHTQAHN